MAHVVVHTAFVGDLLLSIPFFRRVKRLWPAESLTLICRPGLGPLFKHLGVVDEVFELDKKNPVAVRELVSTLNARTGKDSVKYLFCPHESFRTAWVTRSLRAEKKIGFRSWWNFTFFDTRVERPMALPEARRMLSLLRPFESQMALREDATVTDDESLYTPISVEARAQAIQKFSLKKPFIVVGPSSQWPTKKWTPEGFASVIASYRRAGKNVYVIGAPNEAADAENILKLVSAAGEKGERAGTANSAAAEVRSLVGKTSLEDLHAIMAESELVIANDSGPMHMATVAGVPVVAIFGPTTLKLGYRPWSNHSAVVEKDLFCRPCGKHGHVKCPLGTHECMKSISADDVLRAGDRLTRPATP